MDTLFTLPTEQPKKPVKQWQNVCIKDVVPDGEKIAVRFTVVHNRKTLHGQFFNPYWNQAIVWIGYEHTIRVPRYIQNELATKTMEWFRNKENELNTNVTGFAAQPITLQPERVSISITISPERLAQLERADQMVSALGKLADLQAQGINYEIKGIEGKQLTRNVFVTLWRMVEGENETFPNLQAVYGEPQAYLPEAMQKAITQWEANYGTQE